MGLRYLSLVDEPRPGILDLIQELAGTDSKLLNHPCTAYIPVALEEGELPKALVESTNGIVVATDRRLLLVKKAPWHRRIRVDAYPYDDVQSFTADMGFMSMGFMLITKSGKLVTIPTRRRNSGQGLCMWCRLVCLLARTTRPHPLHFHRHLWRQRRRTSPRPLLLWSVSWPLP